MLRPFAWGLKISSWYSAKVSFYLRNICHECVYDAYINIGNGNSWRGRKTENYRVNLLCRRHVKPVQTDATLLANNFQHCWMLHVASVCTHCCSCCTRLHAALRSILHLSLIFLLINKSLNDELINRLTETEMSGSRTISTLSKQSKK